MLINSSGKNTEMRVQLSIFLRPRKSSIHVVPEKGNGKGEVLVPGDETEGIRVIGLSY
jgi:hypothetical protein